MKVAICGAGPLGIEIGIRFQILGASVTLISQEGPGNHFAQMAGLFPDLSFLTPWAQLTSQEGRGLLKEKGHLLFEAPTKLEEVPTLKEYWEQYLSPLISLSGIQEDFRKAKVLRIHKRFLSPEEEIPSRSRLLDLFRVVISVATEEQVQEQIKQNPDVFQKLGQEVIDSLAFPLETFEDFDIVIDAMGVLNNPLPLGAGGVLALGESKFAHHPQLYYGKEFFLRWPKEPSFQGKVGLVGSGKMAAMVLVFLEEWLLQDKNHLFLISAEENIFERLRSDSQGLGSSLWANLQRIFKKLEEKDQKNFKNFEEKLNEWKELEDYIRVKYPRPQEPIKTLSIFSGYSVTSVDRLLDRPSFFLTLEHPEFKKAKGGGDNSDLLTLGVDKIIGANGHKIKRELFSGLRIDLTHDEKAALSPTGEHSEPGFFTLGPVGGKESIDGYSLEKGLEQIPAIITNVLSFFTRKDS